MHSTQDQFETTRRRFLMDAGSGLGAVALSAMLADPATANGPVIERLHYPPRAKRIIQILCCGGISHVDTFDYKPGLKQHEGKELAPGQKIETFFGQPGRLMASPFEFKQYGQSGRWVSSLLPHTSQIVDDLTFFMGMVSKSSNHTPATFLMNSGFTQNGYPCVGSWLSYGLGTENGNLPAFVVLPDPRGLPAGGSINWTSGFLPASHQGVAFRTKGDAMPTLFPPKEIAAEDRKAGVAFLNQLNHFAAQQNPLDTALDARIRSYELAARMQMSIPEATDVDREPEHIQRMYGLDRPETQGMGRNCLLARRLAERGVRFVQLFHGGAFGSPRINWDAHEDIVENHTRQARDIDKPVTGLIQDLKQRGMLEDTLVMFTTEFGRTPITQGLGQKGRDHHPGVFTLWLAGGGLKPGATLGASDEIGLGPAGPATTVYDLHATVLRLLGIDHKRLTHYHNGVQRRLTDVHGHVIEQALA